MPAVDLLQRVGDLADRGLGAGRVDREREQVAVEASRLPAPRSADVGQRLERAAYVVVVALGAQPLELGDLLAVDVVVVDPEHVELVLGGEPVGVDADDLLGAGVDARLGAGGGLLDAHLGDALLDGLGHAAGLLGLLDVRPGALGEVVGEPLDVVGAGPRVDGARWCRDSCCSSSWVLRAIRAEKSVGSAIASSRALVCSDWVWPWVAAIASMQVRPTLLKTSCAVSDQPLVWLVGAQADSDLGFCGSNSRTSRAHSARAARILATSMKKFMPIAQKKLQPRRELVDRRGRRRGRRGCTRRRRRACRRARGRPSPRPPGCGSRRSRSS